MRIRSEPEHALLRRDAAQVPTTLLRNHTMEDRYEIAWRTVLMALSLTVALMSFGQSRFTVNGRLKIEGADLSGARAVVYKDGQKERTITNGLNKFSLDLDLNANYLISFEKEGFVSKKLSFNTKVPPEAMAQSFTEFDYGVSLFKQYDDINIVVFNQPVGVIRYEPSQQDFDYDTDYTRSIQSQLEEVLAAVEKKQKEESKNAGAEAKRAAAAARAQAKAAAREEQAREEEAARKAEAEARAKQPPPPPPAPPQEPEPTPPAPVEEPPVKVERTPPPPPGLVQHKGTRAGDMGGSEERRTIRTMMGEESSPVAPAQAMTSTEEAPVVEIPLPEVTRHEDLIVEPNKVVTVVVLEVDSVRTEYRRVAHKWGDIFYFKDGKACSALVYQTEAMGPDRLVSATP